MQKLALISIIIGEGLETHSKYNLDQIDLRFRNIMSKFHLKLVSCNVRSYGQTYEIWHIFCVRPVVI